MDNGTSSNVKQAWVDPTWARGLLRVRLTPHPGREETVADSLQAARLPHADDVEIRSGLSATRVRDPHYLEAAISLRKLVGETTDVETMKKRLAEFVTEIFRAAG